MLEAILWDNDGVLVNTEALYYEACRRTLANEGTELSREMYVRISMTEGRSVFDLIDLDRDERARLRSDRDKVYMGLLSSRDLTLPGVRETLEGLDGRLRPERRAAGREGKEKRRTSTPASRRIMMQAGERGLEASQADAPGSAATIDGKWIALIEWA